MNRKRYAEVIRLLKEVIGNERAGIARRMKAADMLLSVYDRHDRATERAERQAAALRAEQVQPSVQAEETPAIPAQNDQAGSDALEKAFAFLKTSKASNAG